MRARRKHCSKTEFNWIYSDFSFSVSIVSIPDSGPQKTMIDDKKDGHVTERWVADFDAYYGVTWQQNSLWVPETGWLLHNVRMASLIISETVINWLIKLPICSGG